MFVKCGNCCNEWFRKLENLTNAVVEICKTAVAFQLLNSQQNLVCFNCRSGIFTENLWLTCTARFLLFAWRHFRPTVGDFFELVSPCRWHCPERFFVKISSEELLLQYEDQY